MLKTIIFRGIQGFVIGVFLIFTVGIVMMALHADSAMISSEFLIHQYLAGGIVGFVFGALNLLFVSERFSLVEATSIHFLGVVCAFIPSAVLAGWMDGTLFMLVRVVSIFLIIYIGIWTVCFLQWKWSVKQINDELNRLH